jgi:prepilin-type N-terminal cleavage/methylation domain-containing protein
MKNQGFTFIELMVVITIGAVVIGTGMVYLNRFNARQKLESVKREVVSNLRLAQNYAKTRQRPVGSNEDLRYVTVTVSGGNLIAGINGVGTTYFTQKLVNSSIGVSLNPAILYYWGGSGQLATNSSGNLFGAGETATVVIRSTKEVTGFITLIIDALGSISDSDFVAETIVEPTATLAPTPTNIIGPTSTLAPTPTGVGLTPTPTPTGASPTCVPKGGSCTKSSRCCSYVCSKKHCK